MGLFDIFRRKKDDVVLGAPNSGPSEPVDLRTLPPPPAAGRVGGTRRAHVTHSSVIVNGEPATPEQIQEVERMAGFDLDGDGRIAGGEAAPTGGIADLISGAMAGVSSVTPGPEDRVTLLERLAALRDSGAIDDAEFEAEKARILGA